METMYLCALDETPLGPFLAVLDAEGIWAVFRGQRLEAHLQHLTRRGADVRFEATPLGEELSAQWRAYFAGRLRHFALPLHWERMTAFQRRVLQATLSIPYGETRTYGQIAAQIGRPRAARAVGQAESANPLPILIPCHRVVAARGLGGYGGADGLPIKRWLLHWEGAL